MPTEEAGGGHFVKERAINDQNILKTASKTQTACGKGNRAFKFRPIPGILKKRR
jgi:hypothetical protein